MTGKGNETKRRIIECALQLFSLKGYFGTSVNDVMAAAKITKGGLYGHFSSKEKLFMAAAEEAGRIWRGIVFQDAAKIEDPLERIIRVAERDMYDYVEAGVFEGGCFFLSCLTEVSGRSAELTRHLMRGFNRFSGIIAAWLSEAQRKGVIEEGADPREVADHIVATLNGATALYAAGRERRHLEGAVNQIGYLLDTLGTTQPERSGEDNG